MGGILSSPDKMETSIVDMISTVKKDGFKLRFPSFKIEPSYDDVKTVSSSSIFSQWIVIMILTLLTYQIFINRNLITNYITNFDSDEFKDDFKEYKRGAISTAGNTSKFIKTNIIDEITEGGKSILKSSYDATKNEVASIAKDSFKFVKNEITGGSDDTKNE